MAGHALNVAGHALNVYVKIINLIVYVIVNMSKTGDQPRDLETYEHLHLSYVCKKS